MSEKAINDDTNSATNSIPCPVCNKIFDKCVVEDHVNKCLFLNTSEHQSKPIRIEINKAKRNNSHLNHTSLEKRARTDLNASTSQVKKLQSEIIELNHTRDAKNKPLAEQMRPNNLEDLVGHAKIFGPGSMLRSLLQQNKIPNMILWGPPGCGKTSLANVIANICKGQSNMRFIKLSATMSGINDVKEVVKVATNDMRFKRQTVLFMDEIHRFNKLQQDTFLPHVESGTIILVGATTENPSFSLNNSLLSRCRVVVMEKLSIDDVLQILKQTLKKSGKAIIQSQNAKGNLDETTEEDLPRCIVEERSLQWLAEICDGDARIALGALELALAAKDDDTDLHMTGPAVLTLEDIKNGIKRTHMLYDRKGEEHYNTISALHKSIRASDDNASLYWTTRALHGGEDPIYIARRLVRMACEDIGLADPNALVEAVACLQGCQNIGMPECDVLLAQCAVRLARAPKSREVYCAMKRCQASLAQCKGPLPPVPLHLRNAPTKLMRQLGYGTGYNLSHKDESGLSYMPEGMEDCQFISFRDIDDN